jgi:tryptophan-rich sensory protein
MAMFGLLAASVAILLMKQQRFSLISLLYLLNGALCSLFSYLFFSANNATGTLLLSAAMLLISFFIFRYSLDSCMLSAGLLLPYVFWLAFLVDLIYFTVLFGA